MTGEPFFASPKFQASSVHRPLTREENNGWTTCLLCLVWKTKQNMYMEQHGVFHGKWVENICLVKQKIKKSLT